MVLVYGLTGSTVLSEISVRLSTIGVNTTFPTGSYALLLGIILLIAGFGFKITAFPFQMWAPDVYEGAPTPITTFLSVASKAAGFAVILRVLYTAFDFPDVAVEWSYIFAILAALSMTIGNIIAIAQRNIKRMLAYSTIAHAGYIMVGVAAYPAVHQSGLGEDGGASGVLFYLAAYALGNLVAFSAIIGASSHLGNDRIDSYSGMARRAPLIGVPLALSMISLTGLPPTAGFMAKIYIFGAAVDNGLAWLAIIGVLNSVLSAFYYFRIIKIMVLAAPLQNTPIRLERLVLFALMVTTIGVLLFGIYPTPLIELAKSAVSSFL
jgi:NADH-quinone oxidoreductase subunit N